MYIAYKYYIPFMLKVMETDKGYDFFKKRIFFNIFAY